jgi:hypothetical protein
MGFEMKLSKGVWERCRWIFERNSKVTREFTKD